MVLIEKGGKLFIRKKTKKVHKKPRFARGRVVSTRPKTVYRRRPTTFRSPLGASVETMIRGTSITNDAPSAVSVGSLTYACYYDTSNPVVAPSPAFGTPLALSAIPQGTQHNQRVGDYIYGKNIKLNLQVVMNDNSLLSSGKQPIQFKVTLFKNRRSHAPYATVKDPKNSLYINQSGDEVGLASPMNLNDQYSARTNKRNFIIYKTAFFKLSPSHNQGAVTAGGEIYQTGKQYPQIKNLSMSCPIWKKLHYGLASNLLDNYDDHFKLQVVAMPTQTGQDRCDYFKCNLRASLFYNDV